MSTAKEDLLSIGVEVTFPIRHAPPIELAGGLLDIYRPPSAGCPSPHRPLSSRLQEVRPRLSSRTDGLPDRKWAFNRWFAEPSKTNNCSYSMERQYELESLRRSTAMLRVGAPALDREAAMVLVRELQELEQQIRRLRDGMQRLLDESS